MTKLGAQRTMSDDHDSPTTPHLAEGWRCQAAGAPGDAEAAYRRALAAGEAGAHRYLGALLVELDRPTEAVPVLEDGLRGGDPGCELHLGNALADLGDFDAALARYRHAAQAGDLEAWHSYGSLLRNLGRYEDAIPAWQTAYEADVLEGMVFASLLADAERFDEAIAVLRREAADGNLDALVDIGAIEQDRGRLDVAEDILRDALADGATEAYVYLASVLERTGRASEGRRILRAGARRGIGTAEMQLANVLARIDVDNPEIERLYRRAIKHGEEEAETNLGVHLFELDRLDEAERLLETAAARGDELAQDTLIELRKGDRS